MSTPTNDGGPDNDPVFEGISHKHWRGDFGATGHIAKGGRSLCGFEQPHMNIEIVDSDFEKWVSENRDFLGFCKQCLKAFDSLAARNQTTT